MRNFLKNLKIVIFFDFFAEDVLKSLLRGPKTIRKKYQVVFEKFANLCSKNRKKNQPPILARVFEKSNFFEIFWDFRKKYVETHSKRIRNRFEKMASSLRDISLKKKVSRPSHPIPSIPPVRHSRGGDAWEPGGDPFVVPYGFLIIWDLSFLILSRLLFFWFQKHPLGSTFFGSRNIFIMWRTGGMGWMDGMVGKLFF